MTAHRTGRPGRRAATAVAAGLAVVLLGAGCSTVSTESDQVVLHYDAGAFSSTEFQECVLANKRTWDGPGEKYFKYPAGQRTFDFSGAEGALAQPYTVVSKDNQELSVSGGLTFQLDTSCDGDGDSGGGMLREFHEEIGLKFQPVLNDDGTAADGWLELLRFYIGQPLNKALTAEAQKYTWLALYNDPATRVKFETAINSNLAEAVKSTTGGKAYFLNFNLTLQKPTPRKELVDGLVAVQVAITQRQAIVEQNATVQEKLKQIRALVAVLGPDGYILYEVMQRCLTGEATAGCPTFMPIPPGGNVNVPAPAGKPAG
jgi:hypothetical protein